MAYSILLLWLIPYLKYLLGLIPNYWIMAYSLGLSTVILYPLDISTIFYENIILTFTYSAIIVLFPHHWGGHAELIRNLVLEFIRNAWRWNFAWNFPKAGFFSEFFCWKMSEIRRILSEIQFLLSSVQNSVFIKFCPKLEEIYTKIRLIMVGKVC